MDSYLFTFQTAFLLITGVAAGTPAWSAGPAATTEVSSRADVIQRQGELQTLSSVDLATLGQAAPQTTRAKQRTTNDSHGQQDTELAASTTAAGGGRRVS